MEYIGENYIWIIVVGVIVLMTIIGYFADKADTSKEKKKEKKEKKVIETVPEVEIEQNNDELPPEWDENNKPVDEEQEIMTIGTPDDFENWDVLPNMDLNFENEEQNVVNQVIENEVPNFEDSMINDTEMDLPQEFDLVSEVEESVTSEEPVNIVDNSVNEINIENTNDIIGEEIPEQKDLNELEITLPDIENIKEEVDDDDVWKF